MRRRVREQAHPVAEAVGADGDDREDELDDIAGVLADSEVRISQNAGLDLPHRRSPALNPYSRHALL